MESVLQLLRKDAKAWWWHVQLRCQGKVREARRLERESIRLHVEVLRKAKNGGYVLVGDHGHSITYAHNGRNGGEATLSGYEHLDGPTVQAAMRLGIPVINTAGMSVPDVIKAPMGAVGRKADKPPYGGLSFVTLSYLLDYYKAHGAQVFNA